MTREDEIHQVEEMLRWGIEVMERLFGLTEAFEVTSKMLEAREALRRKMTL
jgi:hypothetical protein